MNKLLIIRKKHIYFAVLLATLVTLVYLFTIRGETEQFSVTVNGNMTTHGSMTANGGLAAKENTFHMVTGEFSATLPDGQKIEAYRWDPGTIFVKKGVKTTLSIYGVNGHDHPFIIEGLDIKGEAKQGEETIVTFTAQHEGVYRMICLTHPDKTSKGPMIAYIVVQ